MAAADPWWDFVMANDLLRDLRSDNAIKARLAICVLSVPYDADLNENLSWFFEVLHALDPNLQHGALMGTLCHFKFKE